MEQLEMEGIAEAVLAEAGADDSEAPRLAHVARALLGDHPIDYAPHLPGDAVLARVHDRWTIYLRRGLSVERRGFAVAHELAEWWLRVRERYQGEDSEHVANYVAAAIMSPRRAFRNAMNTHGRAFAELAAAFRVTETQVALREAEVAGVARAVVSPALVRLRGPEEWVWPAEDVVRRWARRPVKGLRKVRLTDDPRRIVLDGEAVGDDLT